MLQSLGSMVAKWTSQAEEDLIGIFLESSRLFGAMQAERYVDGVNSSIDRLAFMPLMAPERMALDPPLRVHPHGSHVIVYQIVGADILIVRSLHGRCDWEREFQ